MSVDQGLAALSGGVGNTVALGEDDEAVTVQVRSLVTAQISPFAEAITPIVGDVMLIIAGASPPNAIIALLKDHISTASKALAIATVRPRKSDDDDGAALAARITERERDIRFATTEQTVELLLAVIAANKDFLKGRLTQALQAAKTQIRGIGQTQSPS